MRISSFFRRALAVCLVLCALTSFCACQEKASVPMKDYSWSFVNAVHNGQFIHYSPNAGLDTSGKRYENATPLDVTLTVKGKNLTITDQTNNKIYKGTYSVKQSDAHGTEFIVSFNGVEGRAITASDKMHGDVQAGTLLTITINYYIITFRAS